RVDQRIGPAGAHEAVVPVGPADAVFGPGVATRVGQTVHHRPGAGGAADPGAGAESHADGRIDGVEPGGGEPGIGPPAAAVRSEQIEDRSADHRRLEHAAGDPDLAAADHQGRDLHIYPGRDAEQSAYSADRVGDEPAMVGSRTARRERHLRFELFLQEAVSLRASFTASRASRREYPKEKN